MSFEIYAMVNNGIDKFYYENKECVDGDSFRAITVIAALQGMALNPVGVLGAVVDIWGPSAGIADLVGGHASYELLHVLKDSTDALAMCDDTTVGAITIDARESHWIGADTVRSLSYNFSPGDNPGAEFIQTIHQGLEDTSFNSWGVLKMLTYVFARASQDLGSTKTPWISISLRH